MEGLKAQLEELHARSIWQDKKFKGQNGFDQARKLNEAHADLQRCIWKLDKVEEWESE